MKDKPLINLVAAAALCLVLALCWLMAGKIEPKLAFAIDEIELSHESVTVGKNSDICYDRVPEQFLTITRAGDHFEWTVNDRYSDSLQYFKINDVNPNKHVIRDDDGQRISLQLPTSMRGDTVSVTMTGADVWRLWKERFGKQHDVLARHLAAKWLLERDSVSSDDRLRYLNQMQQHDVRSFFERSGDGMVMVILDRHTVITDRIGDSDTTIRYARRGVTEGTGETAGRCKVQFFAVSNHCYLDDSPEEGTFQIDGVNYVMKANVRLTEWGAGHAMIAATDGGLLVTYPKPITIVSSIDTLRSKASQSSGVITLKQANNSFPNKSDLFMPEFSHTINFDLCNVEFFHGGDSAVVLRDNLYKPTVVRHHRTAGLPWPAVPAFDPVTLSSGPDAVHARVGIIDRAFYLSYLWLPLAVFLLLLLAIWLPKSQLKTNSNTWIYRDYRAYLTLLLTAGLAYCACKSLIALKLSYTYPYFEKLTGITPAATALTLLVAFTMTMLLNEILGKRPKRLWWLWIPCALALTLVCAVFFGLMDNEISGRVIASYFPSQVFTWPQNWFSDGAMGINDTHRSVVYALMLVEAVLLGLWLLWHSCSATISARAKKLLSKPLYWGERWNERLMKWLRRKQRDLDNLGVLRQLARAGNRSKVMRHLGTHPLLRITLAACTLTFALLMLDSLWWTIGLTILALVLPPFFYGALIDAIEVLFPWHLLTIVLVAIVGKALGNFGTAFITLAVVVGLCRALATAACKLNDAENATERYAVQVEMLYIVLAYTAGSMWGDHGYMTNFLGFVACLPVYMWITRRPATGPGTRKETWAYRVTVAVLLVVAISLPQICSRIFDPENVNYSRMPRRVMLYSNFDSLQKSGYRYSDSDAEFMVILSHYMQGDSLAGTTHDPLSNDAHFMHPSVSAGQKPVVLDDLSVPAAFFGSYGLIATGVVFFTMLALLLWLVVRHTINLDGSNPERFSTCMQWRLMALMMWVGTSLYIYASYIDWMPFTGRLIPGFGVDAVGEALESAFLLAFMGCIDSKK